MSRIRLAFLSLTVVLMFGACTIEESRFCFGDGLCVEPDGQQVLSDGQPICELTNTCETGGTGGTSGGGDNDVNVGDTDINGDIDDGGTTLLCACINANDNDSDDDCIPDDVEDANNNGFVDIWQNVGGVPTCFEPALGDIAGETDPNDPDTDNDGIPDGCEDKDRDGVVDIVNDIPVETQGFLADSDCDGIDDGVEDANKNGIIEAPNESSPLLTDSDFDGIDDGLEDRNGDGNVDPWQDVDGDGCFGSGDIPGETSARSIDSDGDQIPDQVEDNNFNGQCDPDETCGWNPDTDCDTLQDGREDLNHNGTVNSQETDPLNADTDGDGINDGLEDTNGNGRFDPDETSALLVDTDGDSIPDGVEDANRNGMLEAFDDSLNGNGDGCFDDGELPGELDPRTSDTDGDGIPDNFEDRDQDGVCATDLLPDPLDVSTLVRTFVESCAFIADTDCDGLSDGLEDVNRNGTFEIGELDPKRRDTDLDGLSDGCPDGLSTDLCEDRNNDGVVDSDETDPHLVDTDGDDLTDGCERTFEGGPTDPLASDSDGDGVGDGEEDGNSNCVFEPNIDNCTPPSTCFETDPRVFDAPPAPNTIEFTEWSVCATRNLKEITFASSSRESHDYRLALEVEKEPSGATCTTVADCAAGEICDNQICARRAAYFVRAYGRDNDSDGFNPNDLDDDLFGHIFQSPRGVVPDPGAQGGFVNRDLYGFMIVKEESGSLDAFMQTLSTSLQDLPTRNTDFVEVVEIGNLPPRPTHDSLPSADFPTAGTFRVNFAQRIFRVTMVGDRPALTVRNGLLIDDEFAGGGPIDPSDVPPAADPVYGSINCNVDPYCHGAFTLYVSGVQRLDQLGVDGGNGALIMTLALTQDDRCGAPGLPACQNADSATAARLYNDRVARLEDLSGGSALARFGAETGKICELRDQQLAVADLLWVVDDSKSMQQTITRLQQASRDAQAVLTANSGIVDFRVALTTTNPSRSFRTQCQSNCDETCDFPASCSPTCDEAVGCLKICPPGCNPDCTGCADQTCTSTCIPDPGVDDTGLSAAIVTDSEGGGALGDGDFFLPGGGGSFYYEDTVWMDCDGLTGGVNDCSGVNGFAPFYAGAPETDPATGLIPRKRLQLNAGWSASVPNDCDGLTQTVCLSANADCSIPNEVCERLTDECADGPVVLASQMCDLIRSMGGLPVGDSASARPHSAPEQGTRSARRLLESMIPALPTDYSGPLEATKHLRLQCSTAADASCVPCDPRVDSYCPVVPMVTIFLSDEEDFYFKDDCQSGPSDTDKRQLPSQCNWVDGDPTTLESCDPCQNNNICTGNGDCVAPAECTNISAITGTGICSCLACNEAGQCNDNSDCVSGSCVSGLCACAGPGECTGASSCVAGMCRCDRRDYCETPTPDGPLLYAAPSGYDPDKLSRNTSTGFSYDWPSDPPECITQIPEGCVNDVPGDPCYDQFLADNLANIPTMMNTSCNADPCDQPDQAACEAIELDIGNGAEDYCVWLGNRCLNRCSFHTIADGSTEEEMRCDCDGDGGNPSCAGPGDPFCAWEQAYVNYRTGVNADEACQPKFPMNDCRACKRFTRKLEAAEGVSADPFVPGPNQELVGFGDLGPVYAIVREAGEQAFGGDFFLPEDACEGGFLTWGLGDGQAYRDLAVETLGRTQNVCADSYADFMGLVIADIAALSAPYQLSGFPIAATLKVGIARNDGGDFEYIPVPRSRTQGFFYDATVNTVAFKSDPVDGVCNPGDGCTVDPASNLFELSEILYAQNAPTVPRINDVIFISYRFWKPVPCLEKCGDGEACVRVLCVPEDNPPACPNSTDDDCPLGYVCNLGTQQCEIDCTPGELIDVCVPDVDCGLCQTFNTGTDQCESVGDFCTCNPTGQQACTPGVFSSCPVGFTCDENCGCVRVPGCDGGFTGDGSLASCQDSLDCCLNWEAAQGLCQAAAGETECDSQPVPVCELLNLAYRKTCEDDGSVCTNDNDCTVGVLCLNPFACDNDGSTCDVDADCGGGSCLSPCEQASPCEFGTVSGCDFAYPTCCQVGETPDCFVVPETGEADLFCRTDCECATPCAPTERCELIPGLNTCDCFGVPG